MSEVPVQEAAKPQSLDDVIADLQGFGIEEFEEILTLDSKGKAVKIKISNISGDDDINALLAAEGKTGYELFQWVKAEILSRAITWINGRDVRSLTGAERIVVHPKTKEKVDIRVVLRDTLLSWSTEVRQVLWKILMVHSQNIEDRLFESFPDVAVMTSVEKRYVDRMNRELEEVASDTLRKGAEELLAADGETPVTE